MAEARVCTVVCLGCAFHQADVCSGVWLGLWVVGLVHTGVSRRAEDSLCFNNKQWFEALIS